MEYFLKKVDRESHFLTVERFSIGNVNMGKNFRTSPVYEHTTLTAMRDSFDPRSLNLLREDSICMVNLLEISRMVVFFVNDMIEMLQLFEKSSCVLSSYNENQDVAAMGTLSDQFNLNCK